MDLKRIVRIAMMAALIFAGTYTFKIPIAITGGYTHLGDCAIFVGVMLLGRKDGALAAALGAALSDLLSGAMLWVLPTFIIKGIVALIAGSPSRRKSSCRTARNTAGSSARFWAASARSSAISSSRSCSSALRRQSPPFPPSPCGRLQVSLSPRSSITIMQSSNLVERLKRS
ncbi:MAG: ECF transporter S component [Butyricicoccaceae bacterium]